MYWIKAPTNPSMMNIMIIRVMREPPVEGLGSFEVASEMMTVQP